MAGPQRKKRNHKGDKPIQAKYRLRHKTRDMDQIVGDLKNTNELQKLINQQIDVDKIGLGQHYCIHCATYFQDEKTLHVHMKTKRHKRRCKALEEVPYSQEEAESCAGLGKYNKPWFDVIPSMEEVVDSFKIKEN
ncbi:Zinc finger protein [Intoshia linei]|uniref:Zinc finger protein n=1 Tax=Intoshia linei TaxID=1819745 RepID=A0A177BBY5_9BILA|nr:Zinc finger protein [Intoshia linei]